ncbi:hypothetical protein SISSUDRAFT_1066095 [Sistotremastrum suecicum HHB10207 ss-3]|uniref:Uncharacterized protein n=1 Tax=Sistotremastrum suecicum HHB10207 ss-3 TaxID=1314776 RepID=A0A165YR71_9AGAM|nr:hypothetical protein SISSUDRAFT_1066095 [Sistotremastrum suecicum HHB10207 ss-3]
MSTILQDAAGASRPWHFIQPVDGPDWTNGSTFFIRNKRQPSLYWSVSEVTQDAAIVISDTQKSKFRISGVDLDPKDREKVLIRSDRVTISPARSEKGLKALFIGPSECETDVVVLTGEKSEWRFGDLFGARAPNGSDRIGSVRKTGGNRLPNDRSEPLGLKPRIFAVNCGLQAHNEIKL